MGTPYPKCSVQCFKTHLALLLRAILQTITYMTLVLHLHRRLISRIELRSCSMRLLPLRPITTRMTTILGQNISIIAQIRFLGNSTERLMRKRFGMRTSRFPLIVMLASWMDYSLTSCRSAPASLGGLVGREPL